MSRPPASAPAPFAAFTVAVGWALLGRLVAVLVSLFGTPSELAARGSMPRAEHGLAARWLRAVERFARRVLLIAAGAAPALNAPVAIPGRGRGGRYGRGGFASADSADWGVSFKAAPPKHRLWSKASRRRPPPRWRETLPLAMRLEALVRLAAREQGVKAGQAAQRLASRITGRPRLAWRMLDVGRDAPDACVRSALAAALTVALPAALALHPPDSS